MKTANSNIKNKFISLLTAAVMLFTCTVIPTGELVASAAMSEQGQAVLDAVDSGEITIDGETKTVVDVNISSEDVENDGFRSAVQEQLYSIRDNAEDGCIYRVVIPEGVYECYDGALHVYSNTILDLREGAVIYGQGTTLTSGSSSEGNYSGYDGYENIIILGGEIHGVPQGVDMSSHKAPYASTCMMRFGHAKNIYIVGSKIMDNCGGHHIEAGAIKNLLISDCEITGYADSASGTGTLSLEAIQLDVNHRDTLNFTGYYAKDDYSVENAEIVNNYFHNLRRGVGSHHAVYGHPYNNIRIADNTFTDIADKAIDLDYTSNATISGNTISDATCGIAIYSCIAGTFYLPNSEEERNALTVHKTFDANITVSNNKITLNTDNVSSESWADSTKYGIRVYGTEITDNNRDKGYEPTADTLPPTGIYYISGVTVTNNAITTVNNEKTSYLRCAIRLNHAKNCTVTKNTVNAAAASDASKSSSGINLLTTANCTVSSNSVKNAYNGISVSTGSTGDKVISNTVSSCIQSGISVSSKSTVDSINSNTVSGTFTHGICVSGTSKVGKINANKITGGKKNGIIITESSQVTGTISSNTVSSTGTHGILIFSKAKAASITKNTIKSTKGSGILVYTSATANSITSNKLSKTKKYAISISDKSTCKSFSGNKITSCANKNKIYISPNSKGIVLNKTSIKIKKKKSATIKVSFKAANKKKVTWKSSNKKIATVKNGKIKAKKKGTCTITVTQNGVSAKCKVTVN